MTAWMANTRQRSEPERVSVTVAMYRRVMLNWSLYIVNI